MSYGKAFTELPAGIALATGHKFAVYQDGSVRQVDASAVGGAPAGSSGQLQYNASGSFAAMTSTLWDETNGSLSIYGKTITTFAPAIYLSQTWNDVATNFMLLRLNIEDTASGSTSSFITCSVSGSTLFKVQKNGAITFGAWQGTAIGATYGGTGQTTWTTGDLLYASGTNTVAKRAIGATNQILTVVSGVPTWRAPTIHQRIINSNVTLDLTDWGGHCFQPASDTTPRSVAIPSNASVAYDIGAAISFFCHPSAGGLTITCTDTLLQSPDGLTGSRTLAPGGIATAVKMDSTLWMISGPGLT